MNGEDVLKYGNEWVLGHVNGLLEEHWDTEEVCGVWSVKGIFSHLVSFEHLFVDVFDMVSGSEPGLYFKMFSEEGGQIFNDKQVGIRQDNSVEDLLLEFKETNIMVGEKYNSISLEQRRETGIIPWYGEEYDLEDFIVYANYAHKREHCAQIAVFRDKVTPN